MRKKSALLLGVLFLRPLPVWSGVMDYRPRLLSAEADLTAQLGYSSNVDRATDPAVAGGVRDWSVKVKNIRESLNLKTVSYIYSPDLFACKLFGSGLLDQNENENGGNTTSRKVITENYDLRGFLLRRKDYRGEIYVNSNTPFFTTRGQPGEMAKSQSGIDLYYKKDFWRTSATVKHNKSQYEFDSQVFDQISSSASYRKDDIDFIALGDHGLSNSGGREQTVDKLEMSGRTVYREVNFFTQYEGEKRNEETNLSQGYSFSEIADGKLPWNSKWRGQYRHKVDDSVTSGRGSVNHALEEGMDLGLENKLFESLNSLVSGKMANNRSSGGGSKSQYLTVETHYKKKTWGGAVLGDLSNRVAQVENRGRTTERQTFPLAGISDKVVGLNAPPLVIPRGDIDPLLLVLEVETERGAGFFVTVPAVYWYQKTDQPGLQIYIKESIEDFFRRSGYPLSADQLYTFRVSYTTQPADYVVQTNDTSLHLGIGFFENAWHSDYAHNYTTQDVVSGEVNGALSPAITSDSLALTGVLGPLRLSTSYQWVLADYLGKRWSSSLEFDREIKLLGPVVSKLTMEARKLNSWLSSATGESTQDQEHTTKGGFSTSLPLPGVGVDLSHVLNFEMRRGYVNEFQGYFNRMMAIPLQDRDLISSHLHIGTRIPFTKVLVSGNVYYEREMLQGGKLTVRTGYKLGSGYNWNFGATNLNLSGNYTAEATELVMGGLEDTRIRNLTDLNLKLTRRFF